MTREEAVKILKKCRETSLKYTFYTLNEYQTATDMAIEALEQTNKIADIVDGTIDHFEYNDAMDMLYEIKGVIK